MNMVVITGSPHKKGTSALLTERFLQGAKEGKNNVFLFHGAFEKVHPCIGCDVCGMGKNPCVFHDSMTPLYEALKNADMVVFVTPLYYHGMSAQIKTVIDRFHGIDDLLRHKNKKAILIVTAASDEERIMNGVVGSYEETLHYLGWQNAGTLLAYGCYSREDIEKTDYPKKAYEMGRAVK